jgi:hypothetical protein
MPTSRIDEAARRGAHTAHARRGVRPRRSAEIPGNIGVLISHGHRFIFVHISKTAGTSMKRALAPYCTRQPRTGIRRLLSHLQHLCFDQHLDFLERRRWTRDPTQRVRLIDARGRLPRDPILRGESLNADFAALCRRPQLAEIPELPRRNTSRHEPSHRYYERRETGDKFVDLFAADFETFGYETVV